MKALKKILGVILVIVGSAVVLLGIGVTFGLIYDMRESGPDGAGIWALILSSCIIIGGIECIFGGKILFRGRKKAGREGRQEKKQISRKSVHRGDAWRRSEVIPSPEKITASQEQILPPSLEDRFTLLVEDAFNLYTRGCIVTGILKAGTLSICDKIWILKSDGARQLAIAEKMEAFHDETADNIITAHGDTRIGILVPNIDEKDVLPGSVLSNITPNMEDVGIPLENPRLKGLLAGRHHTDLESIGELSRQEIMNHARFLVFVSTDNPPEETVDGTTAFQQKSTMSFPYLTGPSGDNFQPAFTDWTEVQQWIQEEEFHPDIMIMSADEVFSLVRGNDVLQGAVINPFTDNLILEEDKIEEWSNHLGGRT